MFVYETPRGATVAWVFVYVDSVDGRQSAHCQGLLTLLEVPPQGYFVFWARPFVSFVSSPPGASGFLGGARAHDPQHQTTCESSGSTLRPLAGAPQPEHHR